jgi:hypothetical protein
VNLQSPGLNFAIAAALSNETIEFHDFEVSCGERKSRIVKGFRRKMPDQLDPVRPNRVRHAICALKYICTVLRPHR